MSDERTPALSDERTPALPPPPPPSRRCRPLPAARRRAATLTCKRFRDVIYSEPALWDTVSLQCDAYVDSGLCHYGLGARRRRWLEGKRALLSRVGGLLWRLQLSDRAAVECTVPEPSGLRHPESPGGPGSHAPPPRHPWLFSELLPLAGPQLQSLHLQLGGQSRGEGYARRNEQYPLQPLPAEVAASLPRLFPQLAHLKLRVLSLPACAPGVLRQLPCLSKLQLDVQEALPEGVVPALEAATALTSLRLASSQAPLPPVQGLAASMRHLRHLRLHDGGHRQSGLALPPPASFPELQSYHFKGAAHTSLQVNAACRCCPPAPAAALRCAAWRMLACGGAGDGARVRRPSSLPARGRFQLCSSHAALPCPAGWRRDAAGVLVRHTWRLRWQPYPEAAGRAGGEAGGAAPSLLPLLPLCACQHAALAL